MKRSEMVNLIEVFNSMLDTLQFDNGKQYASALLEVIERAGMLPPFRGDEYDIGDLEWEPEDE